MIKLGLLKANLFCLYFTRNARDGSTLTIGGVDSSHFTGNFTFTPVVEYSYVRQIPLSSILFLRHRFRRVRPRANIEISSPRTVGR